MENYFNQRIIFHVTDSYFFHIKAYVYLPWINIGVNISRLVVKFPGIILVYMSVYQPKYSIKDWVLITQSKTKLSIFSFFLKFLMNFIQKITWLINSVIIINEVTFFLWLDTRFSITIHFWVFLFICFLSQSSHNESISFGETKISSICESYYKDKKIKAGRNPDASRRHWTKETRNSI